MSIVVILMSFFLLFSPYHTSQVDVSKSADEEVTRKDWNSDSDKSEDTFSMNLDPYQSPKSCQKMIDSLKESLKFAESTWEPGAKIAEVRGEASRLIEALDNMLDSSKLTDNQKAKMYVFLGQALQLSRGDGKSRHVQNTDQAYSLAKKLNPSTILPKPIVFYGLAERAGDELLSRANKAASKKDWFAVRRQLSWAELIEHFLGGDPIIKPAEVEKLRKQLAQHPIYPPIADTPENTIRALEVAAHNKDTKAFQNLLTKTHPLQKSLVKLTQKTNVCEFDKEAEKEATLCVMRKILPDGPFTKVECKLLSEQSQSCYVEGYENKATLLLLKEGLTWKIGPSDRPEPEMRSRMQMHRLTQLGW